MEKRNIIREIIEEIDIPDSLTPENAEKLIVKKNDKKPVNKVEVSVTTPNHNGRNGIGYRVFISIMACSIIIFGLSTYLKEVKDKEQRALTQTELILSSKTADDYSEIIKFTEKLRVLFPKKFITTNIQELDKAPTVTDSLEGENELNNDKSIVVEKNIFYLYSGKILITEVDEGKVKEVYKLGENKKNYKQMYVVDNTLIAISDSSEYDRLVNQRSLEFGEVETNCETTVETFDISNPIEPKLVTEYKQSGKYRDSQIIGKNVNLFTIENPWNNYDSTNIESFIPSYSINGEKKLISANDIYLTKKVGDCEFSVVSILNIEDSEKPLVSIKSVLEKHGLAYFIDDSIFLLGVNDAGDRAESTQSTQSTLTKFKFENNDISYKKRTYIDGQVVDKDNISFYKNTIRVVTDKIFEKNSIKGLYVLNLELQTIGKLDNLIETSEGNLNVEVKISDNRVYLKGNKTIDISDYTNPRVMSQDENNSYLTNKPFTDSLAVGIETVLDDETGKNTVKLSINTINDVSKLLEISEFVISNENFNVNSSAINNPTRLFVDTEKSIIGVATYTKGEFDINTKYHLLKYTEDTGLEMIGEVGYDVFETEKVIKDAVCIGEIIYLFSESQIISASIDDMKVIEKMSIE